MIPILISISFTVGFIVAWFCARSHYQRIILRYQWRVEAARRNPLLTESEIQAMAKVSNESERLYRIWAHDAPYRQREVLNGYLNPRG